LTVLNVFVANDLDDRRAHAEFQPPSDAQLDFDRIAMSQRFPKGAHLVRTIRPNEVRPLRVISKAGQVALELSMNA
jgi:hypothetical protein